MNYTSFDRPAQEVSDETIITEFEFSSQVYADSNFTELYTPGNRVTGNVKKFALMQETILIEKINNCKFKFSNVF